MADVQLGMERVEGQLEANAKMREATAGKMLAIEPGAASEAAPKKFYPMLVPRTNNMTREANIFNMVFVSRSI